MGEVIKFRRVPKLADTSRALLDTGGTILANGKDEYIDKNITENRRKQEIIKKARILNNEKLIREYNLLNTSK